jgi:hypothetical protein
VKEKRSEVSGPESNPDADDEKKDNEFMFNIFYDDQEIKKTKQAQEYDAFQLLID